MPINLKADPPVATLVSEDAEAVVKQLDVSAQGDRGGKERNKSSQIRRF